jgi:hypothetical protein
VYVHSIIVTIIFVQFIHSYDSIKEHPSQEKNNNANFYHHDQYCHDPYNADLFLSRSWKSHLISFYDNTMSNNNVRMVQICCYNIFIRIPNRVSRMSIQSVLLLFSHHHHVVANNDNIIVMSTIVLSSSLGTNDENITSSSYYSTITSSLQQPINTVLYLIWTLGIKILSSILRSQHFQ